MSAVRHVLMASVLMVAACADDDDDDDDGASATTGDRSVATPASAAPVTRGPVSAPPVASTPTSAAPGAGVTTAPPAATVTAAPTGPRPEPVVAFTEVADLNAPVDLAWRAGDDGLYVAEQAGRIVRLGEGEPITVLDITDLTEAQNERGLLGLAFSPEGDLAYINYTDSQGWTIISEHPVDAEGTFGTGDSARLVMEVEQPYPNHNGGDLTFGPDGMLYIGMGDGGSGGDPQRRATDLSSLLGKMLRIDPTPGEGQAYTVPEDNPFVGQDAAPEVWSTGLRNPWRFSFDRETGDLWIADVGQNVVEEIDVAPATGGRDAGKGLSFGWSAFEGDERFNEDVPAEGHVDPFTTYTHSEGCSVSGGVRARGDTAGNLVGWYVYGDYCSGTVWAVEVLGDGTALVRGRTVELGEVPDLTAIVEGRSGELYALSQSGPVLRLDPT